MNGLPYPLAFGAQFETTLLMRCASTWWNRAMPCAQTHTHFEADGRLHDQRRTGMSKLILRTMKARSDSSVEYADIGFGLVGPFDDGFDSGFGA